MKEKKTTEEKSKKEDEILEEGFFYICQELEKLIFNYQKRIKPQTFLYMTFTKLFSIGLSCAPTVEKMRELIDETFEECLKKYEKNEEKGK